MSARDSANLAHALRLVTKSGWTPARAAARAGLAPSTVYRAMKRYGIACTGTPGRKPKKHR